MLRSFKRLLIGLTAGAILTASALPANANVRPYSAKTDTYAGYVTNSGTIAAGTGFTVKHNSTGSYTVTYPSSKFPGGYPAMTITGWGENGVIPIAVLSYTTCGSGNCTFDILTYSTSGTAADNGFVFTIVQAR